MLNEIGFDLAEFGRAESSSRRREFLASFAIILLVCIELTKLFDGPQISELLTAMIAAFGLGLLVVSILFIIRAAAPRPISLTVAKSGVTFIYRSGTAKFRDWSQLGPRARILVLSNSPEYPGFFGTKFQVHRNFGHGFWIPVACSDALRYAAHDSGLVELTTPWKRHYVTGWRRLGTVICWKPSTLTR